MELFPAEQNHEIQQKKSQRKPPGKLHHRGGLILGNACKQIAGAPNDVADHAGTKRRGGGIFPVPGSHIPSSFLRLIPVEAHTRAAFGKPAIYGCCDYYTSKSGICNRIVFSFLTID